MSNQQVSIEVVYGTATEQKIVSMVVEPGTQAQTAVQQSHINEFFAQCDLSAVKLGLFGKVIPAEYILQAGDRVEIYRPLLADPKVSRQLRAAKARARRD